MWVSVFTIVCFSRPATTWRVCLIVAWCCLFTCCSLLGLESFMNVLCSVPNQLTQKKFQLDKMTQEEYHIHVHHTKAQPRRTVYHNPRCKGGLLWHNSDHVALCSLSRGFQTLIESQDCNMFESTQWPRKSDRHVARLRVA